MEIKGAKVLFTPSEAHWAQSAGMRFRAAPELAQKILEARVELARPWLPAEQLPTVDVATAMEDMESGLALSWAMERLHKMALERATTDAGEQAVIAVEMSKEEKARLLNLAELDYDIAQEQLEAK